MKLVTDRLEIYPLAPDELVLLTQNLTELEKRLKIKYSAEPIEGHFRTIVEQQTAICRNDPDNYLFHTFWLIIRKSDSVAVGSADFKCPPDENGEVEIGYGLNKEFEKHGYMTETVRAMCTWAFIRKDVHTVIAETELDNIASQSILKRCGFEIYRRETTLWWKKSVETL
ncbi:MAG: GNAT family N-acetyltransferase [Clostridia bacterium]|nr:GNAT family N-acetyltransferase [Clostridia bacterium]